MEIGYFDYHCEISKIRFNIPRKIKKKLKKKLGDDWQEFKNNYVASMVHRKLEQHF